MGYDTAKGALMKHSVISGLALLALGACTVAKPVGTRALGPDLAVGGGTYSSPGGLSVAVDVQNFQGRTGVCGVWAQSLSQSAMTKFSAPVVLAKGAVVFDGEVILQGLHQLAEVAPAPSYAGQVGNCFVSERPWSAQDVTRRAEIVIPRQVVRNAEMDLGEEGGFVITFRPGGPSAHPSDPKPWD